MARSFKKNNFSGNTTSESEKHNKEIYHRGRRKSERNALASYRVIYDPMNDPLDDFEDLEFEEEVKTGGFMFAKDGKRMFDVDKFPELKRK